MIYALVIYNAPSRWLSYTLVISMYFSTSLLSPPLVPPPSAPTSTHKTSALDVPLPVRVVFVCGPPWGNSDGGFPHHTTCCSGSGPFVVHRRASVQHKDKSEKNNLYQLQLHTDPTLWMFVHQHRRCTKGCVREHNRMSLNFEHGMGVIEQKNH